MKKGGYFRYTIRTKTDTFPITGEYIEIERPDRLVFTWNAPWLQDANTVVTIILKESGNDKTEMIMTHDNFPSEELRDRNFKGWDEIIHNIGSSN